MSADLHRAPLAVTSTGEVLVNAEQLITDGTMAEAFAAAKTQHGAIFIGVPLKHAEIQQVLQRLQHGCHEAVAYVIGARRKKERGSTQ